jgi:hypothetical protein
MTRKIQMPGYSMPRFSRRNLLRGGLAASAAIPLLDARRLLGQTETQTPTRIVVFTTPNGTRNDFFWPTGSESSFTLKDYTAPLEAFKDRLLFLKGIRHCPAVVGDNGFNGSKNGSEHARGTGGMLTARPLSAGNFKSFMASSGWGTGISLDQQIANELAPDTTFKSLQLGVHVRDAEVRGRVSYTAADQPVPPRENPSDVFDALFKGATMGTASDGTPAPEDASLDRLRAQRRSVFDLSKREIERLQLRLGKDDRTKLEAHMDSIREIEVRLGGVEAATGGTGTDPGTAVSNSTCAVPELDLNVDLNDDALLLETGRLQMDMAAAALACDQTRIMTFQWSYSESEHLYQFLNLSRNHHAISHDWDANSTGFAEYGQIQTWLAEQLAYFLGKLDSYAEGDGTLLDNTIVFWASEIGESTQHDLTMMPYVLAGGGNKLRTGRLVDYGATKHDNNQLLVSLAQMMGASQTTSFGDESGMTGELPDLI